MNTDKLLAKIEHEIDLNGGNRHHYPISFGKHNGEWTVVIEVNNSRRTFDIETISPSLTAALTDALTHLRRAFAHPR